jgi:TetR/AcrR family transcriptional regulator
MAHGTTRQSEQQPLRRRGRPPAAPEAHAAVRQRLLDATQAVFAQSGYHGLSVEQVLTESGLSRPTFYKHFRNTDEAIEIVIQSINDRLIESLLAAVAGQRDPFAALEAGLNAWRQWGDSLGPLLRPLFAELHDAHSPASRHRRRTIAILGERLRELIATLGRNRPTQLQVDALLNGVEYLGYRFQLETARDDANWKQTRDAMLRLALAMLGNAHEWQHALPLAQALHIDLEPQDAATGAAHKIAQRDTRPRR